MNARQTTDLATLKRVYDFITSTPPAPPLATPPAALPFLTAQLRTAITKAERAASQQGSGSGQMTTAQRAALRRTLRMRYLVPLRHIARVLAKTMPGLENVVQVPKKGCSETALLAAAQATLREVTPYEAAFVARGLAADFRAQLATAIATVEAAAHTNLAARRQQITATAELKAAIDDGRDLVISIGYVIQIACDHDFVNGPATRETWARIQHVRGATAVPLPVGVLTVPAVVPRLIAA